MTVLKTLQTLLSEEALTVRIKCNKTGFKAVSLLHFQTFFLEQTRDNMVITSLIMSLSLPYRLLYLS